MRARASQLVAVDRADQIVVGAEIEALGSRGSSPSSAISRIGTWRVCSLARRCDCEPQRIAVGQPTC